MEIENYCGSLEKVCISQKAQFTCQQFAKMQLKNKRKKNFASAK